jgi:hypothetical protein
MTDDVHPATSQADPFLFINYRIADTGAAASALARALKREFDSGQIFIDYTGIEGGVAWRKRLEQVLDKTTVLFTLIGKDWLRLADPKLGIRRIDVSDDWVRLEIEHALRRGKKVVPIFVDEPPDLDENELPISIRRIAALQRRPLRTTGAFQEDFTRLVTLLQGEGFRRQSHPWHISPDSINNRVELHRFVGRNWLTEKLDAFLRNRANGYFVVEAQSGLGKTSFLAHLVETRGYIHHFVELQPGTAGILPGLRNLAAQIVRSFGLEEAWIDDLLGGIDTRADFLERLLALASSRHRPGTTVVLVVDGLDLAGTPDGQNVLGLPRRLPNSFYFVVSQRPVATRLETDTPREVVTISPTDDANLRDLAAYVRQRLPGANSTIDEVVRRSEGNWIYAYYVCSEIEAGRRDATDLEGLPRGLWQYYSRFWMDWRDRHEQEWNSSHLAVLSTLSAAQESLTVAGLSELSGTAEPTARRLITTDWRPFVTVTPDPDGHRVQLYHASLRDFAGDAPILDGLTSAERTFASELRNSTVRRHAAIADHSLQQWGGMSLDAMRDAGNLEHSRTYGWRHTTTHLSRAGRTDMLRGLLRAQWTFQEEIPILIPGWRGRLVRWLNRRRGCTHLHIPRNAWFESHAQVGDLALFVADWDRAAATTRLLAPTQAMGMELAAYLVKSSVRDGARRIPPGVVVALVRTGRWSVDQALAFSRELTEGADRAELLTEIVALDDSTRPAVLRDAIDAIESFENPGQRIGALVRLLAAAKGDDREGLVRRVPALLHSLSSSDFIDHAAQLVPHLAAEHWSAYLECVERLKTPLLRLRALTASAAALTDASRLEAALARARQESLEQAERMEPADGSLALAIVASLTRGAEGETLAELAMITAINAIYSADILREEPYEAVAVVASTFPRRVSDDKLTSTIESLLSIRYPGEPSPEMIVFAAIGGVTTEQMRSRLAARLIGVAAPRALARIEKAVLRTRIRFHDWYPYQHLARRHAELGNVRSALAIIQRIDDKGCRGETLADIADHLDQAGLRAALKMVDHERLELFRRTSYEDTRYYEVEQAEIGLPSSLGLLPRQAQLGGEAEALSRLRELRAANDDETWPKLVSRLAPHVSQPVLNDLLRMAMDFRDMEQVVVTLCELAPFLPEDKVRSLIPVMRRIGYSLNTVKRITWSRSTRSTEGIKDIELRKGALFPLARRLAELGRPTEALHELILFIQVANRYRTAQDVAECLADIAPTLSPDLLDRALQLVALHSEQRRPRALQALVPMLAREHINACLAMVHNIGEDGCRAWGIATLLPIADVGQLRSLTAEAWENLKSPFWGRPHVLGLLAPYHEQALEEIAAEVSKGEEFGLKCLEHLLPHASGSMASHMISLAERTYCVADMLELAQFLPEHMFRESLAEVTRTTPEALFHHSGRLRSVSLRLLALNDIAAAFTFALRIPDRFQRTDVTRRLSGSLQNLPVAQLDTIWSNEVTAARPRPRRDAFGFVAAVAPLVHARGGLEAILGLYEAIQETGRWWY